MKPILILAILLLTITASASVIVSKEITWTEYPILGYIGIGDSVETTTYSDGYQEGVYRRGILTSASIFAAPDKITIPAGQTSVNWEYKLEGQSCSLTGAYSLHKVDWYFDGELYYSEDLGFIECDKIKTYQTKDYRENDVGTHTITLKETMWNLNGMIVTEERRITLVIEPNIDVTPTPTPTSTPAPNTGTISITSIPSGATVRVNSIEKGDTPVSFTMPPGNYIVSTSLSGYKTDNYGMTVVSGKTVSHNANMQLLSTPTPVPTTTSPSTPMPTSTVTTTTTPTATPSATTPKPTSTIDIEVDCYPGTTWNSESQKCVSIIGDIPITPSNDTNAYIIIGIISIIAIYIFVWRKD